MVAIDRFSAVTGGSVQVIGFSVDPVLECSVDVPVVKVWQE